MWGVLLKHSVRTWDEFLTLLILTGSKGRQTGSGYEKGTLQGGVNGTTVLLFPQVKLYSPY